jgi:hypothetical protein
LKISAADDNTIYQKNFDANKVSRFNSTYVGKNVDELISEFGEPASITNRSNYEFTDQLAEIKSFNYMRGEFRLQYSSQRDARLDYIRLSCVVSKGKIIMMENVLYEE